MEHPLTTTCLSATEVTPLWAKRLVSCPTRAFGWKRQISISRWFRQNVANTWGVVEICYLCSVLAANSQICWIWFLKCLSLLVDLNHIYTSFWHQPKLLKFKTTPSFMSLCVFIWRASHNTVGLWAAIQITMKFSGRMHYGSGKNTLYFVVYPRLIYCVAHCETEHVSTFYCFPLKND